MKTKRTFKLSRAQWISVAVLASSIGLAAAVTIPNTFVSGTTISSTQVNANFTSLKSAVDTLEARIPSAKAFQTTSSGLFPATEGDLRTFTVTTPGAGQVVISMSGWFRMTHANPTPTSLSLWVRQGATKYRAVTDSVPGAYPSANPTVHTFSFTAAFPVASAGMHDIIVSGLSNVAADWGDCGSLVLGCPIVTLQYLPGTLP